MLLWAVFSGEFKSSCVPSSFSLFGALSSTGSGTGADDARSAVLDCPRTMAKYLSAADDEGFGVVGRLILCFGCSLAATKCTRFLLMPAPKYL